MKTSYRYFAAIYGLSLLTACSEDRIQLNVDDHAALLPITLFAAYPTATRASDAGFEDGDRMGVYVLDYSGDKPQGITDDNVHASNVGFWFDESDNIWKGTSNLYWTSKDTPADIIGYYPYASDISDASSHTFSIQKRQDKNKNDSEAGTGGYEASDFLWAKSQKAMPSDSRVDLTFRHLMAGVRVTLIEGTGFAAGEWSKLDKNVLIPNIKPTANIDIEEGTVGDASGDPIHVHAYADGADWRAVVVPQTVAAGDNVIDITVDGVSYHLTKKEDLSYSGGKLNSFTITVDRRSGGKYDFSITDESIIAWLDDVDFRDGIVRSYRIVDVPQKGSLRQSVEKSGLSLSSITSLKLTGEINEEDFRLMRDEMSALKALNLEYVTVWSENRKNHIPERAMYEKTSLAHIVFPKNVEIIESWAFYGSGLMGSLIIPEGVRRIGSDPIEVENYGQLGISNNLYGAFGYCKNLVGELILPSTLEFIGDNSFSQNHFTGTLRIPESVKEIGNFAFESNSFTGVLNIPEGVKVIGSGAFARNKFSGDLVIPVGIKSIGAACFQECDFSGTLYIPDGVVTINSRAFYGCGFRGELILPSTLRTIGNLAFSDTKFSSVIFPEKLGSIGEGAFMNCRNLRGSVSIPENVLRVSEYLFCRCPLITEVIIPKSVIYVGGGAFYGCGALNSLICENPEPPMVSYIDNDAYRVFELTDEHVGPFDGISKSNFTLEVPKKSVDLYKMADGWMDFTRISEHSNFICRPSAVCALNSKHTETLTLNSTGEWEIAEKPDWCKLSKESGSQKTEISLTVSDLSKGSSNREGKIVFRLKGTDITTDCKVSQYDCQHAEDECITLQKASKGRGIDILFLGDGWNAASISDGSYLNMVSEQMEAFFGIEPFTSYRDYFNVYACICLSQDSGVNTSASWYNTRFSTFYYHDIVTGESSLNFDDMEYVFDYAVAHSPLTTERLPQSLIIMALNSDEYGSVSILTEEGSAIAICCSSPETYPMDTRGIIQHEACGHAFGKLAEERIVKNRYISDEEKERINECQWRGWYQNISLSGKQSDVQWNHLIYDPRYNAVDIFEGAYGKARGAFRCEINSCMNYGIPYFNAISRQEIMRRILDYSGEGFTMEKFYATDSDKWGPTGTTRAALPDDSNAYVNSCMHHPVRIVKSKKY